MPVSPWDYLTGPQIMAESSNNPNAVSPKGATGLMQIMPATARDPGYGVPNIFDLARSMGRDVPSDDPITLQNLLRDPEVNTAFGVAYRDAMIRQRGGNVPEGVAAYNAGPGAVDAAGGIPNYPETEEYVRRVMAPGPPQAGLASPGGVMARTDQPMRQGGLLGEAPGRPQMAARGDAPMAAASMAADAEPEPFWKSDKFGNMLDAVAIGANSLRMTPDAGIARAARGRMAGRAQTAQANKTVEFLKKSGRPDLAEAVSSGGMDARTALSTIYAQPQDERTALQQNFEFFRKMGYSDAEALTAIKSGGAGTTINMGDGQPQVNSKGQILVQGPDGRWKYENVEGGAADMAAAGAAAAEAVAADNADQKASVIGGSVDTLVGMIDKSGVFDLPEAGIVGEGLAWLGVNQEAVDFKRTLESVQANIAFDTLQKMRDASKTGGALGGVSERELTLLMSAAGAIQQDMSPKLLKENLKTIKRIMTKIENDPVAGQFYATGAPGAAPAATGDPDFPRTGGNG